MVAVVIRIRYNIRYGRIGAADSDVEEAASAADMHSRILTFPNGKNTCYMAGNVFPTARALVGYFEVTWHLTMKLFPAKISEWATLQTSMTSEGNSALLPANVDWRPPLQRGLMNFQLNNK